MRSGAQAALQARISPAQVTPDGAPLLESVDCVTTYTPQVRIPYYDLSFEVVDSTATTSTTDPTPGLPTPATPPATDGGTPADRARPAVPVPGQPTFVG